QLDLATVKQTFVIQTHDFVVANYLGTVLNSIREKAPNLLFDIQLLDKQSNQRLESGQVDLLIGAGLTAKDNFHQQPLIDEPIMCLFEKTHPVINSWNDKNIFSYAHLKMALLEGVNDPISQYALSQQLTRKIGLQVESLNLQLSLLVGSEMLAFLPQSMCEQGKQQYGLQFQAPPFSLPTIHIRSVWNPRLHNDALHQWVRQQIKTSFSL
ncbi:MAG: LysR substrate-binding domain-containing protein, partial [Psychromonas sp.]